jgi:hypothetical protein
VDQDHASLKIKCSGGETQACLAQVWDGRRQVSLQKLKRHQIAVQQTNRTLDCLHLQSVRGHDCAAGHLGPGGAGHSPRIATLHSESEADPRLKSNRGTFSGSVYTCKNNSGQAWAGQGTAVREGRAMSHLAGGGHSSPQALADEGLGQHSGRHCSC